MSLTGKNAVVTGGGRGIGRAIALAFAQAGAEVLVCGRNEDVLKEAAALHDLISFTVCDVTSRESVVALAETAKERMGSVAVVVNNAGIALSEKFGKTTEDMWSRTMEINVAGTYRVTQVFEPMLRASGGAGRVINIASTAARVGFSYTSAYCASKHAVLGMTRAVAHEWAKTGVTVNCICPSWVESEMFERTLEGIQTKTGKSKQEARGILEAMSPQQRITTPEEVAAVAVFLAGEGAAGITGQAWNVDGGTVMS